MHDIDQFERDRTGDAAPHMRQRPFVIAHRGASLLAPENTLLAFRLAVEAGADALETDAHLTQDGMIALIHDTELARTTNCSGSVGSRCMAELAGCDAGYWFAPGIAAEHPFRGTGLRVPALADLFDLLDGLTSDVLVNIEIKNIPGSITFDPTERLAEQLVRQLNELTATERTIVSSFNPASIDRVKELDSSIRTAYLCTPWADLHARTAYAVARGHEALHPHESSLPAQSARDVVRMIQSAGLAVHVWTVNDPHRWNALAQAGVDGIITDDPGRMRRWLDE